MNLKSKLWIRWIIISWLVLIKMRCVNWYFLNYIIFNFFKIKSDFNTVDLLGLKLHSYFLELVPSHKHWVRVDSPTGSEINNDPFSPPQHVGFKNHDSRPINKTLGRYQILRLQHTHVPQSQRYSQKIWICRARSQTRESKVKWKTPV